VPMDDCAVTKAAASGEEAPTTANFPRTDQPRAIQDDPKMRAVKKRMIIVVWASSFLLPNSRRRAWSRSRRVRASRLQLHKHTS